jgi:DNA-binding SARP family transcriptional activator
VPYLTLCLLGPPLVELDGQPVQLGRHKAVALLAYLALTGQPHSRDALATLLWPELDQSHARGQLRRTLSLLNRSLGKGWLVIDRETAAWAGDAEAWIDVEALRERLAPCTGHGHLPDQVCAECIPLLEGAVDLYRDGFMAGFTLPDAPAFDEWQFFAGEGLREQVADGLQRLVQWYGDRDEYESAIAYARRWLSLDPLHEPAQRELMALYARSARRPCASTPSASGYWRRSWMYLLRRRRSSCTKRSGPAETCCQAHLQWTSTLLKPLCTDTTCLSSSRRSLAENRNWPN